MSWLRSTLAFLMLSIPVLLAACGSADEDSTACAPKDERPCTCEDETSGTQTCRADGKAYGRCVCAPNDEEAEASSSDGQLPFLATCSTNAQCETGLCHPFPSRGPHCTRSCTENAQCEAPSPGCNPMGICRAP